MIRAHPVARDPLARENLHHPFPVARRDAEQVAKAREGEQPLSELDSIGPWERIELDARADFRALEEHDERPDEPAVADVFRGAAEPLLCDLRKDRDERPEALGDASVLAFQNGLSPR